MIPISTDAPLYHYPVATVGLIIANIVCFIAFCTGTRDFDKAEFYASLEPTAAEIAAIEAMPESEQQAAIDELIELKLETIDLPQDPLNLNYGVIRPWQWVTSIFMHADIFHLIGNMIFLWAFGLLVEGKVGWLLFTLLYLAMGIIQSAIEQIVMLGATGGSLGASSAIFALLAVAIVWAPQNSFQCFYQFYFRFGVIDIPILLFGGFYLLKEITFALLESGDGLGSAVLHLMGFAVGVPAALLMLRSNAVDCDDDDLVSMFKGDRRQLEYEQRRKKRPKRSAASLAAEDGKTPKQRRVDLLSSQFDKALAAEKYRVAAALFEQRNLVQPWDWQQPILLQIIRGLLQQQEYEAAEPLIEIYVANFQPHRETLIINQLKIWANQKRPRKLIRTVRTLDATQFTPVERAEIKKIVTVAKKQIADGVIELQ